MSRGSRYHYYLVVYYTLGMISSYNNNNDKKYYHSFPKNNCIIDKRQKGGFIGLQQTRVYSMTSRNIEDGITTEIT